jgi:hypothetical protein
MIIYASQASRYFPYIKDKFLNRYTCAGFSMEFIEKVSNDEWYGFHHACGTGDEFITAANSFNEAYKNKRRLVFDGNKHFIPLDEVRDKFQVVYGIVNPEYVLKQSHDFVFSTIIHPVDKVYEHFFYIWNMFNVAGFHNITDEDKKLFAGMLNGNTTLEKFIDYYIEQKGNLQFTDNIFWCDNASRQSVKADGNCDFVGVLSDLVSITKTFAFLNKHFNIDLQLSETLQYYTKIKQYCDGNRYRRDDLCKILSDDIEEYELIKQKFLK